METENEQAIDEEFGFRMTDLEEQLAGANGEAVRMDVLKTLVERGGKLKADMDTGLPNNEYQTAALAYRALAAAHEIMVNFPATNQSERKGLNNAKC